MKEENNKSEEVIATSYDLSKINRGYLILKGSGNPNEAHKLIGLILDDGTEIGEIEQIDKVDKYITRYISIYIYVYTCMHIHMYIYVCVYIYIHISIYI